MDKIALGIKGLDKLMNGGVPEGYNLVFTGMPGTGKSLFVHKIIYNLLANGYTVVFVTTDRNPKQLIQEVSNLGMNYSKYIKNKKLILIDVYAGRASDSEILSVDIRDLTKLSLTIDEVISKIKGPVIQVYDVISELFVWNKEDELIIQFLSSIFSKTRQTNGMSLVVINEGLRDNDYISSIKAISQATIKFSLDETRRYLKIEKMIGCPVSTCKSYFKINSKNGLISFLTK